MVAVLRSRGFLAESGADLKFELEPGPIFLGRLRLLYFGKWKKNDLRMLIFHCIYFCIVIFVLSSFFDTIYVIGAFIYGNLDF